MTEIRNYYPGGNTGSGFYSFYDYIFPGTEGKKIIFLSGPGSGKSDLFKTLGKEMEQHFPAVDYHWSAAVNQALDGVAAEQELCFIDGTAPHWIEPRYPGIGDEIINLGIFRDDTVLIQNRSEIIELTDLKSDCFKKAYNYLFQAAVFYREWQDYYSEARDNGAVNRNILTLTEDFLQNTAGSDTPLRHFFAAAITPEGVDCKLDSLVKKNYGVFAVQGSPGTGIKSIFNYICQQCLLRGIYAEVFHCPLNPQDIDAIIIPGSESIIVDLSNHIVNYEKYLPVKKYKRWLDMEQFVRPQRIDPFAKHIAIARDRFYASIQEAINYLQNAKVYYDKLESYYTAAMDFDGIALLGQQLIAKYIE